MKGYITAAHLSCFLAFLMIASSCSYEFSSRRYGRSMYVKASKENVKPLKITHEITKRLGEPINVLNSEPAQIPAHASNIKPIEKQVLKLNPIAKKRTTKPTEEITRL